MKHNLLLFSLAFGLWMIASCKKENTDIPDPTENEDSIDIGAYALLESSRNAVPYKGKSSVTFVDSAGNELIFPITVFANKTLEGCLYKYDVHQQGDTVKYCYKTEYDSYGLVNNANNLYFQIMLEAKPFYSDPESRKVADVLHVSIRDATETGKYHQVYYQTIALRSFPLLYDDNTTFAQLTFWGRDFSNVSKTNFAIPYRLVFYNQEFGIVAFTDHNGKLWRFKEMF